MIALLLLVALPFFFIYVFPIIMNETQFFMATANEAFLIFFVGLALWLWFNVHILYQFAFKPGHARRRSLIQFRDGEKVQAYIEEATLIEEKKERHLYELILNFKNRRGTDILYKVNYNRKPDLSGPIREGSIPLVLNDGKKGTAIISGNHPNDSVIGLTFMTLLWVIGNIAYAAGVLYYFYGKYGSRIGLRFLHWTHPWVMAPFVGLIIVLGLTYLMNSVQNKSGRVPSQNKLIADGYAAIAKIVKVSNTGMIINEQPEIRIVLNYFDYLGNEKNVTIKRIVPVIDLDYYKRDAVEILYHPDLPDVILTDDLLRGEEYIVLQEEGAR